MLNIFGQFFQKKKILEAQSTAVYAAKKAIAIKVA